MMQNLPAHIVKCEFDGHLFSKYQACPMDLWDGTKRVTLCSQIHRNQYEAKHNVTLRPMSDAIDAALAQIEAVTQ